MLLGAAATAATVAMAFGGYLRVFVDLPPTLSALALLIACTALPLNFTMVTHNTRHFSIVPGIRLADWLA